MTKQAWRCKAARHSFSLLEIIIVLALIGVIGGITFSFIPFYQTYRFRLEVETLYDTLQELQIEAMTLQSDIQIRFTYNEDKWQAESITDETLLKPLRIELSHVEQIEPATPLILYSSGRLQGAPLLQFSSRYGTRWIDLQGGHLIKLEETKPPPLDFEKPPDLKKIKKEFYGN